MDHHVISPWGCCPRKLSRQIVKPRARPDVDCGLPEQRVKRRVSERNRLVIAYLSKTFKLPHNVSFDSVPVVVFSRTRPPPPQPSDLFTIQNWWRNSQSYRLWGCMPVLHPWVPVLVVKPPIDSLFIVWLVRRKVTPKHLSSS